VILQLKYLIDEKQIVIKSDFSGVLLFLIAHIHLKEYFVKYCSNAIKYASEDPEITSFIEITTKNRFRN
jgi:hypothetical protein